MANAIGPATLYLITDLTTGEGVKIDDLESVSFDPGAQMLGTTNARTGDAWQVDGIYALPPAASVQAELYDIDVDVISAMLLGAEVLGTESKALGFGKAGLTKIDPLKIPALFVLPATDEAAGINSQVGIWLPAVAVESLASIVYNRPTAGGNKNSYTATFKAAQRTTLGAQAVPANCQFGWWGNPEEAGFDMTTTPWVLPS